MQLLDRCGIKFLIGGAYALGHYTGLARDTKDFDLMLRPRDVPFALRTCQSAGYAAEFVFTHWLAKVWSANSFIDIIFRAGNGLGEVDDSWFSNGASCRNLWNCRKNSSCRGIDLAEGVHHGT